MGLEKYSGIQVAEYYGSASDEVSQAETARRWPSILMSTAEEWRRVLETSAKVELAKAYLHFPIDAL